MDKRPTAIDDLVQLRQAGDPQISPGGGRIAFTLKTINLDQNRYETHLWVVPTAPGGAAGATQSPRQWTFSPKGSETSPRWSPDGKHIAFLSARDDGKRTQIHLLPVDGGEADRLTDLPDGSIDGLTWAPDGTRIAFRFRPADPEHSEDAAETRKKEHRSSPPRIVQRLHYREEGAGFVPPLPWRVHVLDIESRAVTAITPEDRDSGLPCWAPDGGSLAIVRNTAPDPDVLPNADAIFVYPASGLSEGEAPRCLNAPLGPKESLAWSPDAAHIAYLGHDDPEEVWGVRNVHSWIVPADGAGAARDLTPEWDVHAGNVAIGDVLGGGAAGPEWTADSRTAFFLATDRGTVNLYGMAIDAAPGSTPKRLTEGMHVVSGCSLDRASESIALLMGTPGDAGNLYAFGLGDSFFRRLTRLNDDVLDGLDLPSPQLFEAPSGGGRSVPCWAILPPDYADAPGPRPTILYIHGGPHLGYGHVLFHEYQALAAAGYVVLYPNPRGSKGYGEEWTAAIRGDWGAPAQEDCLACLDYAATHGWTDPARVGVAGGSYGGYLTGWLIGNVPARWAAAVAERGVFNLLSMAGTCDFVWKDHDYFQANATNDPAEYLRNSPLTYASNVISPVLIIHSEGDLRCPIEQAEQYFAALKRSGKAAVTFLRYGRESNHNLSRGGPPDLRLDRQRRIHEWFDRHLKPSPDVLENG